MFWGPFLNLYLAIFFAILEVCVRTCARTFDRILGPLPSPIPYDFLSLIAGRHSVTFWGPFQHLKVYTSRFSWLNWGYAYERTHGHSVTFWDPFQHLYLMILSAKLRAVTRSHFGAPSSTYNWGYLPAPKSLYITIFLAKLGVRVRTYARTLGYILGPLPAPIPQGGIEFGAGVRGCGGACGAGLARVVNLLFF